MGGRGASSMSKNAFDMITRDEYRKAYTSMLSKMQTHMDLGDNEWSAREYTNAEFLAHMEDANWHSERRQLYNANLTEQELTEIKNKTRVSAYGVGGMLTGKENVTKMINSVKKKRKK